MSDLQQGTLVRDRYRLKEFKGSGSFGEVWLARDEILDIEVAIKVYVSLDQRGIKEFQNEYKAAYGLRHPNLLVTDYFDVWEQRPFLVMKYCRDGSVALRAGEMSEPELWRFIRDVASGLAYLHGQEPDPIVHQDIKPDNILVDEHGNYLITDFGISRRIRSTMRRQSRRAATAGAVAYMGPERFSEDPTPVMASDIWSLGASIYELATGYLPFDGLGGGHQLSGARRPRLHAPWSTDLSDTIRACLAQETWKRPFASDLATFAAAKVEGLQTTAAWLSPASTSADPSTSSTASTASSSSSLSASTHRDQQAKEHIDSRSTQWHAKPQADGPSGGVGQKTERITSPASSSGSSSIGRATVSQVLQETEEPTPCGLIDPYFLDSPPTPAPPRHRHGFASFMIVLSMIFGISEVAFFGFFAPADVGEGNDCFFGLRLDVFCFIFSICILAGLYGLLLLWRWKKLGYWLFLVASIVAVIIFPNGQDFFVPPPFSLPLLLILFGALCIKGKGLSTWRQLENGPLSRVSKKAGIALLSCLLLLTLLRFTPLYYNPINLLWVIPPHRIPYGPFTYLIAVILLIALFCWFSFRKKDVPLWEQLKRSSALKTNKPLQIATLSCLALVTIIWGVKHYHAVTFQWQRYTKQVAECRQLIESAGTTDAVAATHAKAKLSDLRGIEHYHKYYNSRYSKSEALSAELDSRIPQIFDHTVNAARDDRRNSHFAQAITNYKKALDLLPNDSIKSESDDLKGYLGYVIVNDVKFANIDEESNIINDFGSVLKGSDIKFLGPRIDVWSLVDGSNSEEVTFYIKIFSPYGFLKQGSSSPTGYSYSVEKTIFPGTSQIRLLGWGSSSGGVYSAGNYRFELWHDGHKIYSKTFTLN